MFARIVSIKIMIAENTSGDGSGVIKQRRKGRRFSDAHFSVLLCRGVLQKKEESKVNKSHCIKTGN
jgi:hypothetical protein